jgi:hypothetical protein
MHVLQTRRQHLTLIAAAASLPAISTFWLPAILSGCLPAALLLELVLRDVPLALAAAFAVDKQDIIVDRLKRVGIDIGGRPVGQTSKTKNVSELAATLNCPSDLAGVIAAWIGPEETAELLRGTTTKWAQRLPASRLNQFDVLIDNQTDNSYRGRLIFKVEDLKTHHTHVWPTVHHLNLRPNQKVKFADVYPEEFDVWGIKQIHLFDQDTGKMSNLAKVLVLPNEFFG